MTPNETVELAALERAIRSLEPPRAPQGLRLALRHDLARAAAARGSFGLASLLAPVPRSAFAALAALLLITSGWAIAASAPGDVVYPVKDAIVRLLFGPASEDLRVPLFPDVLRPPRATSAPLTPGSDIPPAPAPDRIDAPSVPDVQVPVATPAASPRATPAASEEATPDGPARATPAVPPDPAGPRATPAVPPPRP
jgi:hypothetical protein